MPTQGKPTLGMPTLGIRVFSGRLIIGARQVCGSAAALIGVVVLLGWLLDLGILTTALPGRTTTKANTALGLVAAGVGLTVLIGFHAGRPAWRRTSLAVSTAGGLLALVLGILALIEYGFGVRLGVDELLFTDANTTSPPYPGRMAPPTAAGLACAGTAVLLLGWVAAAAPGTAAVAGMIGRRALALTAHLLMVVPAAIGYLSLTEYACGVSGLYSFGGFVVVALPTATGFALLAVAVLGTYPEVGWCRFLVNRPAAQKVFAPLLLLALLMPLLGGVIVVWGARAHVYDPLYGTAPFALAAAVTLVGMAFVGAAVVQQAEGRLLDSNARLAASEAELRRLNEGLEAHVRREVVAREAAQTRLAHGQRMEALGQLAGGIAHDFNNVMQAVQGGAGLIRRRTADPLAVDHLASMMEDTIRRGAAVTRRLLSFARRGELRAEPVAPDALLVNLQDVLAHTLGAGIAVDIKTAADMPMLLADKGQLETVLINLATNARDAMPDGGRLTLSAAQQVVAPARAQADPVTNRLLAAPPNLQTPSLLAQDVPFDDLLEPGRYIRLAVSDQGEGMSADVLAHACEPFFTTKPQGKGTGLGLAMARGFAEQSGGALAIRSVPGCGTTVVLWLPVMSVLVTGPAAPVLQRPVTGHGDRVMVVDDEDLVREVLAEGLEQRGYQVLRAADAGAALAMLDAGAVVSLLLTDYTMPGMDGLSLIAAARQRLVGLPAVLLTGNASVQSTARIALDHSDAGFRLLRKPIGADKLADCISALLDQAAASV